MASLFKDIDDARALAQAIVDTVREPLLVLDAELRVIAASRSFYHIFKVSRQDVIGQFIDKLADAWNLPTLRKLLETIIPERKSLEGFEIKHLFPGIGHRVLLLNAREVFYEHSPQKSLLLAFEDITARRVIEREKEVLLLRTEELLNQKEVLLQEMQHRIANSLQLIASILLLKSRNVTSEETRQHLQDAHQRVMSVAAVQRQLHAAGRGDVIRISSYFAKLCDSLRDSMIGAERQISLKVICDEGDASSQKAVSLGLIVTELVINSLKHAFPENKAGSEIIVSYEVKDTDWMLAVSDNGIGNQSEINEDVKRGLGRSIIAALAQQLDAQVATESSRHGLKVSVTHATFTSRITQTLQ